MSKVNTFLRPGRSHVLKLAKACLQSQNLILFLRKTNQSTKNRLMTNTCHCNECVDYVPCSSPMYRNGGKTPTEMPKSTPKMLNKHCKICAKYMMSSITGTITQFSAVAKKDHLDNMAEIEKEAVGFPVICHLVEREFVSVAASYFCIFNSFTLFS